MTVRPADEDVEAVRQLRVSLGAVDLLARARYDSESGYASGMARIAEICREAEAALASLSARVSAAETGQAAAERERDDLARRLRDEEMENGQFQRAYEDEKADRAAAEQRAADAENALAEAMHVVSTRRVGGPSMDGSEKWSSPAFKQLADILRPALAAARAGEATGTSQAPSASRCDDADAARRLARPASDSEGSARTDGLAPRGVAGEATEEKETAT